MIVKPPEEKESRVVSLAHDAVAAGQAAGDGVRLAGRGLSKLLGWWLIGVTAFGLVMTLLIAGPIGWLILAIGGVTIWGVRRALR